MNFRMNDFSKRFFWGITFFCLKMIFKTCLCDFIAVWLFLLWQHLSTENEDWWRKKDDGERGKGGGKGRRGKKKEVMEACRWSVQWMGVKKERKKEKDEKKLEKKRRQKKEGVLKVVTPDQWCQAKKNDNETRIIINDCVREKLKERKREIFSFVFQKRERKREVCWDERRRREKILHREWNEWIIIFHVALENIRTRTKQTLKTSPIKF